MARVIVFDVNETLLDLRSLDPWFEATFGHASVRAQWFGQLLQSALVATVTDAYAAFGVIGRAAIDMVAARLGRELSDAERQRLLEEMRRLRPHPEVSSALERLRGAGLRLATLTNSTEEVARSQLGNAGIDGYFERILSADAVSRLKPAREPYEYAAAELGVPIGDTRLVAAHAWDIAGALRAGASAAFVARPGMVLDPLAPVPEIIEDDLTAVAERILELDSD